MDDEKVIINTTALGNILRKYFENLIMHKSITLSEGALVQMICNDIFEMINDNIAENNQEEDDLGANFKL